MIGKPKTALGALDLLVDTLVEDILSAPDEDILAEMRESETDLEAYAADMRALFEKNLIVANKKKLAAARAGVASVQRQAGGASAVIDIAAARARLRAVLDAPGVVGKLTVAARKESELSDADILSMLDDLRELGVLTDDGGNGGG